VKVIEADCCCCCFEDASREISVPEMPEVPATREIKVKSSFWPLIRIRTSSCER